MSSHDFHDPMPLSDSSNMQRIVGKNNTITNYNSIEDLFAEKSKLEKKLGLGETGLTEIIQKFFFGPIGKSLSSILQPKNENNAQEKLIEYDHTILREENLEIYNLLVHGHNGKNLPSAAYKVHYKSGDDDYY